MKRSQVVLCPVSLNITTRLEFGLTSLWSDPTALSISYYHTSWTGVFQLQLQDTPGVRFASVSEARVQVKEPENFSALYSGQSPKAGGNGSTDLLSDLLQGPFAF